MNMRCKIIIAVFCLLVSPCLARPPKVIRMVPENGSVDIKPGPQKIRILFDQDMNTRSHSICGSGENFPEIIGDLQWTSKRAVVLSVNFEPNHYYSFSINCPSARGFKSTSGESAENLVVSFRTTGLNGKAPSITDPELKQKNQQAVHVLKESLENYYSYNDMKNVNWNTLFEKYNDSLLNAGSPMDFSKTAGLILAYARDKHIWMTVNGEQISAYRNPVSPNSNFQTLPNIVPTFKKRNDTVWTGQYPDGIGYISINSWSNSKKENLEQLYAALNEFSGTSGLIIDVRGNGGGSETLAHEFAGCFIDEPKLYAKHVYIDKNSPSGFSEIHERILQPNKTRPHYHGRVIVLTGPVVMSSCEAFVLMMKQVPGCKIIGEPTQGCSGNPKPHDLGNGVTVYLPSWKAMLPDGSCFEGKGIRPDIPVKANPNQIENEDPVIKTALQVLKNKA